MRIDTSKNQTSLVIGKNELTTKFNEIKKIINKNAKNPNFVLVITGDSNNNGNTVPYSYSTEEVNKLLEFNSKFEQFGHYNKILFSEGINLLFENTSNKTVGCWSLPIVLEVNKKIDNIVKNIKNMHLTPYETVLFIHQLSANIQYSCQSSANTMGRETEATLLGLSDKYKHLCCVGYSSFVKAIIDKLQTPNLSADINQFHIFQTGKKTDDPQFIVAHSTNTIYINDQQYGIKGVYFEDSTPLAGTETDFSACLVPIPDLKHYKNRVYHQFQLKSPTDNIHKQINVAGKAFYNVQGSTDELRNNVIKFFYENLPFQDPKTHQFTKNLQYSHYSIETFKEAYASLLKKLEENNIEQKINKATEFAITRAGKFFDKNAENCYAKEFQNKIEDKNEELC